jgi:ribonuclease PH
VALSAACERLLVNKVIQRDPLREPVAAISVGVVGGEILLDLPYAEDSRAEVDMNIVQTASGQLVEVQGTGEAGTFDRSQLDAMLDLGERGIVELIAIQQKVLGR